MNKYVAAPRLRLDKWSYKAGSLFPAVYLIQEDHLT